MSINNDHSFITSEHNILDPKHIWVKARDITVRPSLSDVGGVDGFYMPPISAPNCSLAMKVNGLKLRADNYSWSVCGVRRYASVNGVSISTMLVPVSGLGYIEKIEFTNNAARQTELEVQFALSGSLEVLKSKQWGWCPPVLEKNSRWLPADRAIECKTNQHTIRVDCSGDAEVSSKGLLLPLRLDSHASQAVYLRCQVDQFSDADIFQQYESAIKQLESDYKNTVSAFPVLKSSDKRLENFYNRGLTTFHTCLWESDHFIFSPFMAESGIDGGAVCNYPWGIAYFSKILAISKPKLLKRHIEQILITNLTSHYAYTPLDGSPVGPWYSYNQYSIIACAYYYVTLTGDKDFLYQVVDGKRVYDHLVSHAVFRDDLSKPVALIDYGTNENLLELKQTHDYEHFVPSPNAERCFSYDAVAKLSELIGIDRKDLYQRAQDLRKLIVAKLWSPEKKWLMSLGLEGEERDGYSVQVFDTLRFGILSKEHSDQLVSHLNENEFLSTYGVHSLSKLHPGYDESDVDWGGPGVYAGDAPELVEDLYHSGHEDKADDLLKRILWWGDRFPYYPQAIKAASTDYRHDGRANIVAAPKVNEAIVFGLLGLKFSGSRLSVKPHLPSYISDYSIDNIRILSKVIKIEVTKKGYRITDSGKSEPKWHELDTESVIDL